MLQNLIVNNRLFLPLGMKTFDSAFCFSADNKRTNRTNYKMNAENNQTQIDLWNQQKEYDYQMWKENNEYNTPANQVQRLQDAGINPALALSNISTGESSSSAGGQTPPTTTPGHNEPGWQESMAKVQNLALVGKTFADISKQDAETKQIEMANSWTNTQNALDVASKTRDNSLKDEALYNAKRLNILNDRTFDAKVTQEEERANGMFLANLGQSANNSLLELDKDIKTYYRDNIQPEELRQIKQNISSAMTHSIVEVFDAKTNRMNASTNQYNAETSRLGTMSQIQLNDKTLGEIQSRIDNNIQDEKTKKFWNSLNSENKRWLVTKIVSDAKNSSLQPLWNALGIGANIGTAFLK